MHSRPFTIVLAVSLVLLSVATGQLMPACSANDTEKAFEHFAGQFQFFGFSELLFGDTDLFLVDPAAKEVYLPLLDDFLIRHDSADDLLPLLKHKDPKVRLLAIAALYAKEDAHLLPEIAKLIDDSGHLWPDPPSDIEHAKTAYGEPSPEPKTVGDAAREAIRHYLDAANVGGGEESELFPEYWAARKGRTWCTSWFLLRLRRADEHSSPILTERIPQIRALRREIDRLPMNDRLYVLLQMAATPWDNMTYFLNGEELTRMCHEVGRKTLLALIAGKVKLDDPDMDAQKIGWLVFDHAKDLLEPNDAEAVLAAGNPVGAAGLKPTMASKWLRAAYVPVWIDPNPNDKRMEITTALWQIVGPSESDFIVDWYFAKEHLSNAFGSLREQFWTRVGENPRPELRAFVARILRDPRFDQTGVPSARAIIRIVNTWLPEPLVSAEEIQNSYPHPETDWPNNPFKPLAEWHAKLRRSINAWEAGPTRENE